MRSQHVWKEKGDDGRKREVRATKFGGNWRFQAKFADEAEWTYYDRPLKTDLLECRDIVFRRRGISRRDAKAVWVRRRLAAMVS